MQTVYKCNMNNVCPHPDNLRKAATDLRCPLCMEAEIERLKKEWITLYGVERMRFAAVARLNANIASDQQRIFHYEAAIAQFTAEREAMRAEGALIMHALERALQFTEVLMANLPAGQIVPPGVATCKHALDEALRAITNRRKAP
jgi:hypothetical protein